MLSVTQTLEHFQIGMMGGDGLWRRPSAMKKRSEKLPIKLLLCSTSKLISEHKSNSKHRWMMNTTMISFSYTQCAHDHASLAKLKQMKMFQCNLMIIYLELRIECQVQWKKNYFFSKINICTKSMKEKTQNWKEKNHRFSSAPFVFLFLFLFQTQFRMRAKKNLLVETLVQKNHKINVLNWFYFEWLDLHSFCECIFSTVYSMLPLHISAQT